MLSSVCSLIWGTDFSVRMFVVAYLLLLAVAGGTTRVQAQGCTFSTGNTDYDLTPLAGVYSVWRYLSSALSLQVRLLLGRQHAVPVLHRVGWYVRHALFLLLTSLFFATGICGSLAPCGVAVCEANSGGSYYSMGNYPSTLLAGGSTNNPSAVFSMSFTKATGSIYTVYIDFTCGTTAGAPIYSKEGAGSMYFAWSTMYACSVSGPTTPPIASSSCVIDNPYTGEHFDLSPLKGTTYVNPAGYYSGPGSGSGGYWSYTSYSTYFGTTWTCHENI